MFWLDGWQMDWLFVASALAVVVRMLAAKGLMRGGAV